MPTFPRMHQVGLFAAGLSAGLALASFLRSYDRRKERRGGEVVGEKGATARVVEALNGSAVCLAMSVGHRVGLFDALLALQIEAGQQAGAGPKGHSIEEIARKAGCDERYVQEWCGVMSSARLVQLVGGEDKIADGRYSLSEEASSCLTRVAGAGNMAVYAQEIPMLTAHHEKIEHCFKTGGGVGYDEQPPAFTALMGEMAQAKADTTLVQKFLPSVPGLLQLLAGGGRVLDLGCGEGASTMAMAAAFPHCSFQGIDLDKEAIGNAQREARRRGLGNVRFRVVGAEALLAESGAAAFDYVYANDMIHDLARPEEVLRAIRGVVRPGGIFSMVDIAVESTHSGNLNNGFAPFLYTVSLFHCMTVSLAQPDGAGLGMMWGKQAALAMLRKCGFDGVEVLPIDGDSFNCHFFCKC